MKNKDYKVILDEIYELMPDTKCLKESCANWCCTKLETMVDDEGLFMPLPLVYGVEYKNISDFLKIAYGEKKIPKNFDFSKKSRTCPFKDQNSSKCLIYPVRPFSCRVYGRKVPPVFWGITVPSSQAEEIFCPDMEVVEIGKQEKFQKEYPKLWEKLARLSVKFSPFYPWQNTLLKDEIGTSDILILAFGEYFFLIKQDKKWFKANLKEYWQKMGNKL